jgi:hypothetical protein
MTETLLDHLAATAIAVAFFILFMWEFGLL